MTREDAALPGNQSRECTVYAPAELDLTTTWRLRASIDHALSDGAADVVVNMAETTFMDSTGLRELLLMYRRCHAAARRLVVETSQPGLLQLFSIHGVDGLLSVRPSAA